MNLVVNCIMNCVANCVVNYLRIFVPRNTSENALLLVVYEPSTDKEEDVIKGSVLIDSYGMSFFRNKTRLMFAPSPIPFTLQSTSLLTKILDIEHFCDQFERRQTYYDKDFEQPGVGALPNADASSLDKFKRLKHYQSLHKTKKVTELFYEPDEPVRTNALKSTSWNKYEAEDIGFKTCPVCFASIKPKTDDFNQTQTKNF